MERLKLFTPRGGAKPPKTAKIVHSLANVTLQPAMYLTVSGTGITPVGSPCQLQFIGDGSGGGTIPCLSQVGTDVVFSGCNVHIRSGNGATNAAPNGLGNLIIGYNEATGTRVRTGSHNLVVGMEHQYTSYGGVVAGYSNSITNVSSSVLGGTANVAAGQGAAVLGGTTNQATGSYAAVSGGSNNVASGAKAAVSGGGFNVASNDNAAVSGGGTNTASGMFASVSGGFANRATTTESIVVGGRCNVAGPGPALACPTVAGGSSVLGGQENVASGNLAVVAGGYYNTASALGASVTGGQANVAGPGAPPAKVVPSSAVPSVTGGMYNMATGTAAAVTGGGWNTASGVGASVTGGGVEDPMLSITDVGSDYGLGNIASGRFATVTGGRSNRASGPHGVVLGGMSNTAGVEDPMMSALRGSADFSDAALVCGGQRNRVARSANAILGGYNNAIAMLPGNPSYILGATYWSTIAGGEENRVYPLDSYIGGTSVSGGYQRVANGYWDWRAGGLFQDQ